MILCIIVICMLFVICPYFTMHIAFLIFYSALACSCDVKLPFVLLYLISVFCLIKGKQKANKIKMDEDSIIEKQKTKIKVITGCLTSDVEREVNKFIQDKKVINVTFDQSRFNVTATVLYEEL